MLVNMFLLAPIAFIQSFLKVLKFVLAHYPMCSSSAVILFSSSLIGYGWFVYVLSFKYSQRKKSGGSDLAKEEPTDKLIFWIQFGPQTSARSPEG